MGYIFSLSIYDIFNSFVQWIDLNWFLRWAVSAMGLFILHKENETSLTRFI